MVDFAFRYYVARYKVEAICQKKKKKRKSFDFPSRLLYVIRAVFDWLI